MSHSPVVEADHQAKLSQNRLVRMSIGIMRYRDFRHTILSCIYYKTLSFRMEMFLRYRLSYDSLYADRSMYATNRMDKNESMENHKLFSTGKR